MEKGYVYILTNPSFREDWVKIGKSSRPVDERSKELDNTSVPLPFDVFATLETDKFAEVERLIHKTIDRFTDLRIRQNREFFNVPPQTALDLLVDFATTIEDAVVYKYIGTTPYSYYPVKDAIFDQPKEGKERVVTRKPFAFSMAGIPIGTMITFDPTGIQVKVASENKVEYEDRLWSLSAFTGTYLPENQRNNSGAYQGPKFFSYNGKTMWQLRLEMEERS